MIIHLLLVDDRILWDGYPDSNIGKLLKKLKAFGFEFFRHAAGSHEIWHNPTTGRFTTIPNHSGDMPEGTLRAILKQADIDLQDFLDK